MPEHWRTSRDPCCKVSLPQSPFAMMDWHTQTISTCSTSKFKEHKITCLSTSLNVSFYGGRGGLRALSQMFPFILDVELCAQSLTLGLIYQYTNLNFQKTITVTSILQITTKYSMSKILINTKYTFQITNMCVLAFEAIYNIEISVVQGPSIHIIVSNMSSIAHLQQSTSIYKMLDHWSNSMTFPWLFVLI